MWRVDTPAVPRLPGGGGCSATAADPRVGVCGSTPDERGSGRILRGRACRSVTIGLALSKRRMGEMARRQWGCAGRSVTFGLSLSGERSVWAKR